MARILIIFSLVLFGLIGFAALFKDRSPNDSIEVATEEPSLVITFGDEKPNAPIASPPSEEKPSPSQPLHTPLSSNGLPHADRVNELFNLSEPKLPFIETIEYSSRVPWQKGRAAWISDYARHYKTSRHFIARSLNQKPDYLKQDVANGDLFNVISIDKNIEFYSVVDLSRCSMWLYAYDPDENTRTLLKRYDVCLGKPDENKPSGSLTPTGSYSLGDRVAIYNPKIKGFHKGEKTELVRIFGTRWIPFDKAIADATAPAKGLGMHGLPWKENPATGEWTEESESIKTYSSDGCIRLSSPDMEEFFSIVITRPTTIAIVKDFKEAKLPGKEAGSVQR